MQEHFQVSGMSCAACSARVEQAVRKLEGVRAAQVNLLTRSMVAEWDEARLSAADVVAAVQAAGYGAAVGVADTAGEARADESRALLRRLSLSLVFLLPMVAVCHAEGVPAAELICWALLLPIVVLNRAFFIRGLAGLAKGAPNMDTLIAMGASAAMLYSVADALLLHTGTMYLESAGMILTLITLGKWLEARATGETGSALRRLRALLPETATLRRGEAWVTVPAAEVQPGEVVRVAAGERVSVDGVVTEGVSSIDESAFTGESMPVEKTAGSRVCAGTVNGNGTLLVRAEKAREDSALNGLIHLVGEAAAAKAPIARTADRVSAVFVPCVLLVAVLTAAVWLLCGADAATATGCAIAVLVISCPCALGLATPVAIMVGAGKGAEQGLLFRNGETLETARRVDAVMLDKTGTVTSGHPVLTDVCPQGGTETELLALAAALESGSRHPLAAAVLAAAEARGVAVPEAADGAYRAGRGVSAVVNGVPCAAGNAAYMQELGVAVNTAQAEAWAEEGKTVLYVARGTVLVGLLAVADPMKEGSAEAVRSLREAGIRVLMVTGDHALTAAAVARQAGIEEVVSGALPQDKVEKLRELRAAGHCVAMVGDGINDAPALVAADVGMAIGAGTDVALDSAGMILMRSDLRDVPAALRLSRAVIRTIRQNLFWAFFYNALAIPLAAGVYAPLFGWYLTPPVAAAAMSLSSFCVVCNALRLRRLNLHPNEQNKMNTITIHVEGMMCPHCERHMTEAMLALPHVTACTASHSEKRVVLTVDAPVDPALLEQTVAKAGYGFKGIADK